MVRTQGRKAAGGAKRRLIVHLGVHKTGSTAIQRHLQNNAALLADRLILRVPQPDSPMQDLGRAARQFSMSPGGDTQTALRIAVEDVLATLPGNDLPVIVSHENVAGVPPGKGAQPCLYPLMPRIAEVIRNTAQDFDTGFVVYTRDLQSWRASLWAQIVRSEGYAGDFATFEAEVVDMPGWTDLGQRMSAAVGAAAIAMFRIEDEPEHARPGRQLLRHAGLSEAEIDALPPLQGSSNPRLDPRSTEFIRLVNELPINPQARGKVAELVARNQHLFAADAPSEGTL